MDSESSQRLVTFSVIVWDIISHHVCVMNDSSSSSDVSAVFTRWRSVLCYISLMFTRWPTFHIALSDYSRSSIKVGQWFYLFQWCFRSVHQMAQCAMLCFSGVHQEAQCAMGDACCKLQKTDDDTSTKVQQQICYSGMTTYWNVMCIIYYVRML